MPGVARNARMRETKYEPPSNDVGGVRCCRWIWFRTRPDIADIK